MKKKIGQNYEELFESLRKDKKIMEEIEETKKEFSQMSNRTLLENVTK